MRLRKLGMIQVGVAGTAVLGIMKGKKGSRWGIVALVFFAGQRVSLTAAMDSANKLHRLLPEARTQRP